MHQLSLFLKSFTHEACTTCAGRLFHKLKSNVTQRHYTNRQP